MKTRIAFFDTKPYNSVSFDNHNKDFGFEIHYYETQLNDCNLSSGIFYQRSPVEHCANDIGKYQGVCGWFATLERS